MGRDLRQFIGLLAEQGELTRVKREVTVVYEVAALLKRAAQERAPALLLERVRGYPMPVVGNLCASRQRLALALETSVADLLPAFMNRLAQPLPPVRVSDGPCKEVIKAKVDLVADLPIITAHADDRGPYLTSGIVIARDPESGIANASLHRIHPIAPDRATIAIGPRNDLWRYFQKAEGKGQRLEVAVVIGLHPALLLAAVTSVPTEVDELAVGGSLLQEPIELVRGEVVEVEVPAAAEIVLEGYLLPGVREPEGPFGEFLGYYGGIPQGGPVIQFVTMTCRRQPLYHALITGPTWAYESAYLGCLSREALLYAALRPLSPRLQAIHVFPSRYIGVLQLSHAEVGEAKRLILAALSTLQDLKFVIVVDSDIDSFDVEDVLWAVATRVHPSQDLLLFPGLRLHSQDPYRGEEPGEQVGIKVGIDATIPPDRPRERFHRSVIPGLDKIALEGYLSSLREEKR